MTAPLDLAAMRKRCDKTAAFNGDSHFVDVLPSEMRRILDEVERLAAENARLLDNLRAWRDPVCDAIRARISEISEENWRAGWLRDIEHCVWRDITTGSRDECFGDVTSESLKALSEIIGGWVHWPDGSDSPAFVALDDWTALHAEWLKTKAALRAAGGG